MDTDTTALFFITGRAADAAGTALVAGTGALAATTGDDYTGIATWSSL